jgi:hypothetical protein
MVIKIEDWDAFEQHAEARFGVYQLMENNGYLEVKVLAGQLSFRQEFTYKSDKQLARILAFCRRLGYTKVSEIATESFFE